MPELKQQYYSKFLLQLQFLGARAETAERHTGGEGYNTDGVRYSIDFQNLMFQVGFNQFKLPSFFSWIYLEV